MLKTYFVRYLPNVDGLLVTADNPARADLLGNRMDHARCAALHNHLVRYAWLAEGHAPASLQGNNTNTFFTTHGATAEALRPRLHPSLAAFLDAVMLPPADGPEPAPFFFWASELSDPDCLFADQTADLFDQPADSVVCLYLPNVGQGGESGGGVFYHQGYHRAAVFMHMDDHDYALPVEEHPSLWHPLETVLSNWIDLIRLGKVVASPRDAPALFGSEKIGPWEWRPYGEAQVAACVCAWDRLCDSIEARVIPLLPTSATTTGVEPRPLLAPSVLDAASVPSPSFARAFLSRARRPRFHHIAPGLLLPPADAREFAASQPFTRLPRGPQAIPPVRLFPTARSDLEADLAGRSSPSCSDFRATSRVPAGVYSESVERDAYDNAEEGFRLLLPYGLDGDVGDDDAGAGARKSDGSFVETGAVAELFQHGYKPFGGDYYRPQRLERLLDHWRGLVEEGVWSVSPQGVEGTIDTFRQADTAAHWRDYVISPTW
ncbi:uncharacterized protein F4807DRAFT_469949 [Annulohypoxylon truncatum]|uniref:uncharacterized protein n=1 Tax=Annulohypoxylon truncatum TaxID=327061 RepID=UPI002007D796|nr:uncharacterized protein F4807DRAFT_469949 [Annulohypoxylon truncatum]KAI1206731.1 hypothetical protein F4807DRAFT_469949 [Annulohypoxylon truncatum]